MSIDFSCTSCNQRLPGQRRVRRQNYQVQIVWRGNHRSDAGSGFAPDDGRS